jgi:hypothetical protein
MLQTTPSFGKYCTEEALGKLGADVFAQRCAPAPAPPPGRLMPTPFSAASAAPIAMHPIADFFLNPAVKKAIIFLL